jgi:hypothetical protein
MDREICSSVASLCQILSVILEIPVAMKEAAKAEDGEAAITEPEAKLLAKARAPHIAAAIFAGVQLAVRITSCALWRTRLEQSAKFKEEMNAKESLLVSFSYNIP